jgi:hypothetical protein
MSSELKVVAEQTAEDSLAELLIRTHGEYFEYKLVIFVNTDLFKT